MFLNIPKGLEEQTPCSANVIENCFLLLALTQSHTSTLGLLLFYDKFNQGMFLLISSEDKKGPN